MRQRSSAATPLPSFRRRIKKQERRRRSRMDWRIPLFLGLTSLVLLSISLFLLSEDQPRIVKEDNNVLHIVSTRFMQNQPKLLWLGRARLLLFEYICLPTMVQQSTQNFVWIIHTDPLLAKEIKHKLRQLILPYPPLFLVGYNSNNDKDDKQGNHTVMPFEDFTIHAKDLLKAPVYSGNVKILRQAYLQCCTGENDILLLQTRLDADDGLRLDYLEQIQHEAQNTFSSTISSPHWYYWCIQRHLEWYASTNHWNPVEHTKLCITPGLTVGTPIHIEETISNSGPPWALGHDVLFKKITNHPEKYNCGGSSCIRLVTEDAGAGAIRSRTWTSAGMMNVFPANAHKTHQAALKELVGRQFGLAEDLSVVQLYLQQHISEIAKDNLEGQCTYGHSCKMSSVETLQRLVELQHEGSKGRTPQHPIVADEMK